MVIEIQKRAKLGDAWDGTLRREAWAPAGDPGGAGSTEAPWFAGGGAGEYSRAVRAGLRRGIAVTPTSTAGGGEMSGIAGRLRRSAWLRGLLVTALTALTVGVCAAPAMAEEGILGWGLNDYDTLGAEVIGNPSVPVRTALSLPNGVKISQVATTADYGSMALLSNGNVETWGENEAGQLGNGTYTLGPTPVYVCEPEWSSGTCPSTNRLKEVVAVAQGGRHNLALLKDGEVVAWGNDYFGELGDDVAPYTNTTRDVPVYVCETDWASGPCPATARLKGVSAIAADDRSSMALLNSGEVVDWGAGYYGQLGDGAFTPSTVPTEVCEPEWSGSGCSGHLLGGVAKIASGDIAKMALLASGEVVMWGWDQDGDLGNNASPQTVTTPVYVCEPEWSTGSCPGNHLTGVSAVSDEGEYAMALMNSHTVTSWGTNQFGDLGDDSTVQSHVPVYVCEPEWSSGPCPANRLESVSSISTGGDGGEALLTSTKVVTWGDNPNGELGNGTTTESDAPVFVCEYEWSGGPCPGNQLHGALALNTGGSSLWAFVVVEGLGKTKQEEAEEREEREQKEREEFETSPHWYSDGTRIPAGTPEPVKTSGSITLHLSNGATIACKVKDAETIENPADGLAGIDRLNAFVPKGCKAVGAVCARGEKPELLPGGLPWSTQLIAGPPIRDEITGIELRVNCTHRHVSRTVDVLTGTLDPLVGHSAIEFDAGSGGLAESIGVGHAGASGEDSLKGPARDKVITAATP